MMFAKLADITEYAVSFLGRIKLYQAVRSIQIILVYITVIIQFGGIYIPIGWIAGIYNFYSIPGIKLPDFVGGIISLHIAESQISCSNIDNPCFPCVKRDSTYGSNNSAGQIIFVYIAGTVIFGRIYQPVSRIAGVI